jgi:hypothetical protein
VYLIALYIINDITLIYQKINKKLGCAKYDPNNLLVQVFQVPVSLSSNITGVSNMPYPFY